MPFRWVREDQPDGRWRQLFEQTWPSYRAWFLREGDARRPALEVCRLRLEQHMPELVGTWERLTELAGGDAQAARMLSLYRPTPYLAGCSQAVWSRGEPLLVRNYDYHPSACEGVFLLSEWNGTKVLAASDCLWGALDGMNEHGLVVALAFGGRRVVGDGFGIPLVLRYVLETCRSCAEAVAVLQRIPSHMAYNVSVLDATGAHAVVHLSPDREAVVTSASVVTNHQQDVEWSEYAQRTHSAERERFLVDRLRNPHYDAVGFTRLFLEPPLFSSRFEQGFGTLYTAVYAPLRRSLVCLWPNARIEQSLDKFREQDLVVPLITADAPRVG
jgi:predicted choloylglycine hydrolase